MNKNYLECGKIINTHGIKGALKIESWCDSPYVLAELDRVFLEKNGDFKEYEIVHSSVFKQFVILELDGIMTIEAAEKLRNQVLYLAREDLELEEGEVFIADLIGLPVIDVDTGLEYGKITDVMNTGASDIYVIKTSDGEAMVPAVKEFVKDVDLDKGIFIKPIEGMF